MEPADAVEDATPGMNLMIAVSVQEAEPSIIKIDTELMSRIDLETEIQDGLMQGTFIRLEVVDEGGQTATTFLNVTENLVGITVLEQPRA